MQFLRRDNKIAHQPEFHGGGLLFSLFACLRQTTASLAMPSLPNAIKLLEMRGFIGADAMQCLPRPEMRTIRMRR